MLCTRNIIRTQIFSPAWSQKFYTQRTTPAFLASNTQRPLASRCFAKKDQSQRMESSARELTLDERIARARALRYSHEYPSERRPGMDIRFNTVDQLEHCLQIAGFKKWGFTIYRCTYKSDSDWAEFMRRYRRLVSCSLEYYGGLDMLESFEPTVHEDRLLFEGAASATIREHFQKWALRTVQEEGGASAELIKFYNIHATRYRFCMFVDEDALQSVLQAQLEDCLSKTAYVALLDGWWKPESLEDYDAEELEAYGPQGPIDDDHDPVEGCTQHDVGWMKVLFCDTGLDGFHRLENKSDWKSFYVRPFEICPHM